MSVRDECTKAIAAHASWKTKFKQLIAGETKLDASQVRKCDACDFGRWLASQGTHALGAKYADIDAAHKKFHVVAGGVVEAHNAGKQGTVEAALSMKGDFTQAGVALTTLLTAARDGS